MAKIGKPRSIKGLAVFCARTAEDKIAQNTIILDLTKIETAPAEYFVIASCDTDIQMRAIVAELELRCLELGIDKPKVEGFHDSATWVLIDFFDVIMHLMLPTTRSFYQLEKLWGDASFFKVTDGTATKAIKFEEIKQIIS